jgi:hypothetical protein
MKLLSGISSISRVGETDDGGCVIEVPLQLDAVEPQNGSGDDVNAPFQPERASSVRG